MLQLAQLVDIAVKDRRDKHSLDQEEASMNAPHQSLTAPDRGEYLYDTSMTRPKHDRSLLI